MLISRKQTIDFIGSLEVPVPRLIAAGDERAGKRFVEFFTAAIRNPNTRDAYGRAVRDFCAWCEAHGISRLEEIEPVHIAAYVEQMMRTKSAPTVKQHLAAIRSLFDYLVVGGVFVSNPATGVRGPKYSQRRGKTPVLAAREARRLLDAIPTDDLGGLRDRALIGVMTYAFARVSAALALDARDVVPMQDRLWLRLDEKGGKYHEMPCHHSLERYLRDYIEAAGLKTGPLFRTLRGRSGELTTRRLQRHECLAMVKRRCRKAGLTHPGLCNHTFRGTGITAYLSNPGARLDLAQQMAAHSDPNTTRMYDRRSEAVSPDEIERIAI